LHAQAGDAKFVLHGKILMIRESPKALIKHLGYDIISTQQLVDLRTDLSNITNKAPWVRYWLSIDQESRLKTLYLLPDLKSQLGQDLLAANILFLHLWTKRLFLLNLELQMVFP
jgi:hypothetical protein